MRCDLICDYLKQLRILKQFSLKSVYESTGISDSRLHRFEDGNIRILSIDEIFNLTELYNVSFEEVLMKSGFLKKPNFIFKNTEHLSINDYEHIQNEIDYIIKIKDSKNDF